MELKGLIIDWLGNRSNFCSTYNYALSEITELLKLKQR